VNDHFSLERLKHLKDEFKEWGTAKAIFAFGLGGSLAVMGILALILWHFSKGLPKIITVEDYRPLGVSRVFAVNSKNPVEIGEFFKERRYLIPYEKVPFHVVHAFISAEDDRFFEHPGINIGSMLRASIANFRAGHVVQGGSTITQQVAKSLLLTPERTFDRKLKEIVLASRIEKNLTKQQILYLYLNQIYLGHGAYGVQAASRTYFRKDISEITLAEAALLAGMPQAPGKYSPLLNPKRAKERQMYVLRRMVENKYISQAQMNDAGSQSIKIFRDEDLNNKYAPYYVEYIRKYLVEQFGEKAVYEEGLTISVPLDAELALVASRSVRDGLLAVDKRIGYRGPIRHLSDPAEVKKFLDDQRLKLIEDKVNFQVFLPEGRMDPIEAMRLAGVKLERELLKFGELYEAVVTGIDLKNKSLLVTVGEVLAEVPLAQMKWARVGSEGQHSLTYRNESTQTTKAFKKGDVILVSLLKEDPKSLARDDFSKVRVALEQEPVIQGALFSMDTQTGKVLSMVGGYDFQGSEFNRATQAIRQCGSAFKPIIYSAALEKGFTPASIIIDSPMVFRDAEGLGSWKPNNFESKFYGDTTFRQALIKSRNIPTIKIVQSIQVPYLIQYARRLGMTSSMSPDLSIALGSAAISLMDLTKVYALFPRLGRRANPQFIERAVDRDGHVLEENRAQSRSVVRAVPMPSAVSESPAPQDSVGTPAGLVFPNYPVSDDPDQVLDSRVAYVMTHLMKEVVTLGTGHEAQNLGRQAAGKTGTTNDYIDAWFMGFTPHIVTGVWVGFDNQKSIGPGETGARAALPIWLSYMKEAVKGYPEADFKVPPGVVFSSIDPVSGKLAPANASSAIEEAFIEGTQPSQWSSATQSDSEAQSEFLKEDRE
jgi:penicillin-binding protein 1A